MDSNSYVDARLCSGEPTIGNLCPIRDLCHRYKHGLVLKSIHSKKKSNFVSAFVCQNNNDFHFLPIEPFDDTPFVVLDNGMILKNTGKKQKVGMEVFKILIPSKNYRPLVFDGKDFYATDNITTLEPTVKVEAKIITTRDKRYDI